jgi:hypothetical protein
MGAIRIVDHQISLILRQNPYRQAKWKKWPGGPFSGLISFDKSEKVA